MRVRTAGFEPAISCARDRAAHGARRNTRLSCVLSIKSAQRELNPRFRLGKAAGCRRPTFGRCPHGRVMVCRIVKDQEHRAGLEPASPHDHRCAAVVVTLIKGLLSPLCYAPASRAGGTRTGHRAEHGRCRIRSPVCCRYTTTPCLVGRMRFNRVNIASLLVLRSCQVVALRIELSATWLSAAFGQPALDYLLPTSSSIQSGWQDSK